MHLNWYLHKLSGSQVFIRQPGRQDQVQYLNIDQEVTTLAHLASPHHGAVVLGTTSHLLVYNTEENKIIMTKEVSTSFLLIVSILNMHSFYRWRMV